MPELPPTAFKPVSGGALLCCRVQPGASKSAVSGAYGEDAVKIVLQAPPVDGKANAALCRLLAELCGLPKANVELVSGQTSRSKLIRISGISPEELRALLSRTL